MRAAASDVSICHYRLSRVEYDRAEYSEPEPDVALVTGTVRDYRFAHPTSAVLVVEISDGSLRHDRTVKQRLYARCGIPE